MFAVRSMIRVFSVLYMWLAQCIPHVLAMATDRDANIRSVAELQLVDVMKRYPTFIQVSVACLLFSCCFDGIVT